MSAITDDERREVAARLRALAALPKQDWYGLASALFGDKFRMRSEVVERLADLVEAGDEPGTPKSSEATPKRDGGCRVDRDALLAIADEIDESDVDGCIDWHRRIREACGEEGAHET